MNELKLSKRLEEVVKSIPKGARIADIGSDHAYLPCYAYLQGYITEAIAGEVVEGPFQSAKDQVKKVNLENVIDVRKGNGLAVLEKGEVDCVTIAGMGGTLISTILEEGKEKLEGVTRLILQPNIGAINVRKWLLDNEWEIIDEKILEDEKRIYEIVVAERGEAKKPYGDELESGLLVGPVLRVEKNEAFVKKWTHELSHLKQIASRLSSSAQTEESKQKLARFQQEIKLIEEVLV
ncbi:tRNA (adenine(22)-N(1))-methyltransferase [Priestia koreensis]|uniref:tRNA (adenine(22)-N(1))-methyltransferase n=1 Tax=Priestia koreensis TaxID=284581 RepID=UPI001F57079F|nr:tRNA (adenine(22)-N(1))-methyltransferase TrmK [Priestia koreensis]MCM3002514.1 tRNA (adenine(22)-N(1))-methyltransferase TrmK [Priestia koreensis]UNL84226.1 tRNA (adenine-N(1))-methyltransferase [Priestia koreensis]